MTGLTDFFGDGTPERYQTMVLKAMDFYDQGHLDLATSYAGLSYKHYISDGRTGIHPFEIQDHDGLTIPMLAADYDDIATLIFALRTGADMRLTCDRGLDVYERLNEKYNGSHILNALLDMHAEHIPDADIEKILWLITPADAPDFLYRPQ